MRDKETVLKDLEAFFNQYKNIGVPGNYDDLRNTCKKLRDEVKQHCPNSPVFKRFSVYGRTIDDYKCPEIMEYTQELIVVLKSGLL